MQAALAQRLNAARADGFELGLQLSNPPRIYVARELAQLLHALLQTFNFKPRGAVAGAQRLDFSVLAAQLTRCKPFDFANGRVAAFCRIQVCVCVEGVCNAQRRGLFHAHNLFR